MGSGLAGSSTGEAAESGWGRITEDAGDGWHGEHGGKASFMYLSRLAVPEARWDDVMCMRPGGNHTPTGPHSHTHTTVQVGNLVARGEHGSSSQRPSQEATAASTRWPGPRYQPSGTRRDGKVCTMHAAADGSAQLKRRLLGPTSRQYLARPPVAAGTGDGDQQG